MKKLKEGVYLIEKDNHFRVIYPMRDPQTKELLWRNIILGGSWWRFFGTLFIIFLVLISVWAYRHDIEGYKQVYENPCDYCSKLRLPGKQFESNLTWETQEVSFDGFQNT